MQDHTFCRKELRAARSEAKAAGVAIPNRLRARLVSCGLDNSYFVQGDFDKGNFQTACCGWEAKYKYVCELLPANIAIKKLLNTVCVTDTGGNTYSIPVAAEPGTWVTDTPNGTITVTVRPKEGQPHDSQVVNEKGR